ncbi:MAG: hypothetical protein M1834_005318 [Cirrosporium novae-zelandiae]|nr:MAG: hypothetical protein M1834_005318 [Cirrosporium novae-zelandiae]
MSLGNSDDPDYADPHYVAEMERKVGRAEALAMLEGRITRPFLNNDSDWLTTLMEEMEGDSEPQLPTVAILSSVVAIEKLIPLKFIPAAEDKDQLTPPTLFGRTFEMDKDSIYPWQSRNRKFRELFQALLDYWDDESLDRIPRIVTSLTEVEIIHLPELDSALKHIQHLGEDTYKMKQKQLWVLRFLLQKIHSELNKDERVLDAGEQKFSLGFRERDLVMKNTLGDTQFVGFSNGYVHLQPQISEQPSPVLSCLTHLPHQSWPTFITTTISAMLSQLSLPLTNREVFIIGFHAFDFYIARGFFSEQTRIETYVHGCHGKKFRVQFSRGWNLLRRDDWEEACKALVGLLRYLLSGEAKVGAVLKVVEESGSDSDSDV